jgi:hypothetical protein
MHRIGIAQWVASVTATLVPISSPGLSSAQGRPQSPFGAFHPGFRTDGLRKTHRMAGILARLLALTPSVLVNDVTTGGQHLPTVTVGPAGQVYVAWVDCLTDQDCTTANPDIYFAKSTDNGQHFSARVLVSDDGPGAFANAPKMATDRDGNIYLVWHDNRAATVGDDSWDVYMAKSTDGGASFSASVIVDEHVANAYQYEPDLAVTPGGTIYVSWERYFYDGNAMQWDADVYVAKSTDGGASFGTNVKVSDQVNYQYKSAIGVGPSGNVYVVWTDFRSDGSGDVYFARSTDGGVTFSANMPVNTYTAAAQVYPELAIDGNETVYVVWLDARRYVESANDIYMARSVNLGLSFDPGFRVSDADLPSDSVANYLYPVITAAGDGQVGAAWYDMRTGDTDTYLTRSYDAGLTVMRSWRVNDLTANSQSVPDIFMTANHDVYCVYRDHSSGDFDIYFVLDTTTDSTQSLSVTKTGTGTGSVTSNPGGIDCGNTCLAEFPSGTLVTLTASADSGSAFGGWEGEGCTGTGPCSVTMIQVRPVTADFVSCTVVLSRLTVTTTETYTSCDTLTVGPTFRVEAPGNVTVRAALQVVLANGFSVGPGATFTAGLDLSLAGP